MADYPALPLWTDAYLADCGHLTDAEHGRYLLLLMLVWRAPRCRVPDDDAWLARHLRRSEEDVRGEVRPLVGEFFSADGKWITQKRLLRERKHLDASRERQRRRAKIRWEKEKGACHGNATEQGNGIAPTPTPTPKESSSNEEDSSPTGRVTPLCGDPIGSFGYVRGGLKRREEKIAKSAPVWEAYARAFLSRYGAEPPRNAKVNSLLCELVDRLGVEDASQVAEFFVGHNSRWYVEKGHSVAVMLSDAEKLRTEWATGQTVTNTRARQVDRTASNFAAADEAVRIRERMAESADDLLAIPPFLDRRAAHAS